MIYDDILRVTEKECFKVRLSTHWTGARLRGHLSNSWLLVDSLNATG